MRLTALLLFVSVASVGAQGPRWVPIYAEPGMVMSVDTSTLEAKSADVFATWTSWEHTTAQRLGGPDSKRRYLSSRSRVEIDCASKKSRDFESYYYAQNGTVVDSYTPVDAPEFKSPVPDTYGDVQIRGFCANRNRLTGAFDREIKAAMASWAKGTTSRDSACASPSTVLEEACRARAKLLITPTAKMTAAMRTRLDSLTQWLNSALGIVDRPMPELCLGGSGWITIGKSSFCFPR